MDLFRSLRNGPSAKEFRCGSKRVMVVRAEEELLTVEEVAQLLKVPTSWVYERCRGSASDPLPHVKLGKYLRFYKSELIRYVEKLRRGSNRTA